MYTSITTMNLCQNFKVWYKNKRYFLVFPVVFGLFLLLHWNTTKLQSTNWVTSSYQWNIQAKVSKEFPHIQPWTILVFVGAKRLFKVQFD